jgi:hypothetical protein
MLMMIANNSETNDDAKARALAAILFKNTLLRNVYQGTEKATQNSVWYQIQPETRSQIKEALLNNLGENE